MNGSKRLKSAVALGALGLGATFYFFTRDSNYDSNPLTSNRATLQEERQYSPESPREALTYKPKTLEGEVNNTEIPSEMTEEEWKEHILKSPEYAYRFFDEIICRPDKIGFLSFCTSNINDVRGTYVVNFDRIFPEGSELWDEFRDIYNIWQNSLGRSPGFLEFRGGEILEQTLTDFEKKFPDYDVVWRRFPNFYKKLEETLASLTEEEKKRISASDFLGSFLDHDEYSRFSRSIVTVGDVLDLPGRARFEKYWENPEVKKQYARMEQWDCISIKIQNLSDIKIREPLRDYLGEGLVDYIKDELNPSADFWSALEGFSDASYSKLRNYELPEGLRNIDELREGALSEIARHIETEEERLLALIREEDANMIRFAEKAVKGNGVPLWLLSEEQPDVEEMKGGEIK